MTQARACPRPPRRPWWRWPSRCRRSTAGSPHAGATSWPGRSRSACSPIASASALGGGGGGVDRAHVPGLLPLRRHPQRAVAGPRHGLPARRAAGGGDRRRRWWRLLSAFAAGVLAVAPLTGPGAGRRAARRAATLFGPLPRMLAAVGSGGAALVIIGGALWSAWRLLAGPPARRGYGDGRRRAGWRWATCSSPPARSCCRPAARSTAASASRDGVRRHPAARAWPCCSSASWWRPAPRRPTARARRRRLAAQRRTRRRTLPPRPLRQLVDEQHLGRALVAGEVLAAPRP